MRTQDLLRAQYQQAHGILEQVIDDTSAEAMAHVEGGNLGSISAIYAHLVYDEDGMMRGAGREGTVWESGGWSEKTGIGELSPMQTQEGGAVAAGLRPRGVPRVCAGGVRLDGRVPGGVVR